MLAERKVVTKIEANPLLTAREKERSLVRVAAYCRVSTDSDEQLDSYQAQITYYTDYIAKNPDWRFAGIYADMYNRILIQSSPHRGVEKWLKRRLSAD